MLDPFHAPHANHAHDVQGAVACPPSPAPRQPRRPLAHARWRPSYVLVFVSIATAMPVGAIATESMSACPCHGNEWRNGHPSAYRGVVCV